MRRSGTRATRHWSTDISTDKIWAQQLQRQNLAAAVASIDTFWLSVGQHKSASAPLRPRARHGNRGATAATAATAATTGVRHDGHDATALSWTAATAATAATSRNSCNEQQPHVLDGQRREAHWIHSPSEGRLLRSCGCSSCCTSVATAATSTLEELR